MDFHLNTKDLVNVKKTREAKSSFRKLWDASVKLKTKNMLTTVTTHFL